MRKMKNGPMTVDDLAKSIGCPVWTRKGWGLVTICPDGHLSGPIMDLIAIRYHDGGYIRCMDVINDGGIWQDKPKYMQ